MAASWVQCCCTASGTFPVFLIFIMHPDQLMPGLVCSPCPIHFMHLPIRTVRLHNAELPLLRSAAQHHPIHTPRLLKG